MRHRYPQHIIPFHFLCLFFVFIPDFARLHLLHFHSPHSCNITFQARFTVSFVVALHSVLHIRPISPSFSPVHIHSKVISLLSSLLSCYHSSYSNQPCTRIHQNLTIVDIMVYVNYLYFSSSSSLNVSPTSPLPQFSCFLMLHQHFLRFMPL